MTDGVRALAYFDGRLAAGLGTALWVLGGYVLGAALASGAIAALIDRAGRSRRPVAVRHAATGRAV